MNSPAPTSPLTIIAIFCGIIEASALASLPFLGPESQKTYTWFLVGFPFFLTVLFFLTLNFNHVSLYGPARQNDDHSDCDAAEPERTLTFSGPQAGVNLEKHIMGVLSSAPSREHRWVLYNLECRSRVGLTIRSIHKGEKVTL